jgi:hypothetical protein
MNTHKINILITMLVVALLMGVSSCTEDLDVEPIDDDATTADKVYKNVESYKQALAKVYAGLALTGQKGPAGEPDLNPEAIDEGFSHYLRQYWVAQEIPTDEAVVAWTDPGLPEYNYQSWGSSNNFVMALYSRIFYQITLSNEFIRESSDSKLNERGFSESDKEILREFRAEARFLRAYSYWHALDFFGEVPLITEEDGIGDYRPEQETKKAIFNFIESELTDIEDKLAEPLNNEYARVDKAAAWTLLAKLYLNAEVYIGEQKYTECITYCDKIINSAYDINNEYDHLFLADNHTANGIIFPVAFDGKNTRTYGGTTFLISAAIGGEMNPQDYGTQNEWGGHRVTKQFFDKFGADTTYDNRAMFFIEDQELEINDIKEFGQGLAVTKFKNITSTGESGSDATYMDTDFPVFRLADVYLMYAEAVLRGGTGGSESTAVTYINELRERAYGDDYSAEGKISTADLTLDFVLDERARELYWEGHRRTDLIRYGKFTSSDYVWAWKGQTQEGQATDDMYRLYPIPASELNANPNLKQNDGY